MGSHMTVSLSGEGSGLRNFILKNKRLLESLGHQVTLFDPWALIAWPQYDLLHLYSATIATLALGQAAKAAGIKLVVSPFLDKTIPAPLVRIANNVICKLPKVYTHLAAAKEICDMADLIVAWSDAERDYLVRALGTARQKITVVPYSIDPPDEADPTLFIERHKADKFVLTVGNLGNARKNYLRLIRAAGPLGVPIFFIGPIPDNEYAKACWRLAQKFKNIHLLGFVDKEMLLSAYAAADTYIQPSITEGVGMAALDAALHGAKVVITQNGAPSYYFGEYAEYVDPRSERSIREKLLIAWQKPKTPSLREHLLANFLCDKIKFKLAEAYKSIL